VKDECLADRAPAGQRAEVEHDDQHEHEDDGDGRVDGRDEEAHHHAAQQTQQTRVPAEVAERRPGNIYISMITQTIRPSRHVCQLK